MRNRADRMLPETFSAHGQQAGPTRQDDGEDDHEGDGAAIEHHFQRRGTERRRLAAGHGHQDE